MNGFDIGIISSAVVAVVAVAGLIYSHVKELGEVKNRVAQLETKIEPFWEFVTKSIPDMLIQTKGNPEPITRRDELLLKYRNGIILPHERDELLAILEREREQARRESNTALLVALGLLILVLIASSKK